jgi:surfactin synthase thioesterase subunit
MSTGAKFHGAGSRPQAPAVVYAFGAGGTGAAAWKAFRAELGDRAELRAARVPGRESRQREQPLGSVDEQVQDLAGELAALVGQDPRPYLLLGVCSGALTAFETARRLTAGSGRRPAALLVGGEVAPSRLPGPEVPVPAFSEQEFQDWRARNLPDRPELEDPDTFAFFAPMLQADFSVARSYRHRPLPLLACPVTAVGAAGDGAALRDWAQTTEGVLTLHRQVDPVTAGNLLGPTVAALDALSAAADPGDPGDPDDPDDQAR